MLHTPLVRRTQVPRELSDRGPNFCSIENDRKDEDWIEW